MDMKNETKAAFDNILDTFSGSDGGVGFVRLQALVEQLERQADMGDAAAEPVIQVVHQFSLQIDVANKEV